MFDAVVLSPADPEPAARTFVGLVEGVVDGTVRRVVLVSESDTEDLRKLADAAGCQLLAGVKPAESGNALRPVLETPHVLALTAGALLPPGWTDLLRHDLQRRGPPGFSGGLAFRPARTGARFGLQARFWTHRRVPLGHGAMVARAALVGPDFDGRTATAGTGWRMADLTVQRMEY